MKRVICILASLSIFLTIACSKAETENKQPEEASIQIEKNISDITLPETNSGSATVTFTATADWSVAKTDTRAIPAWFTVSPQHGSAGTHTLTITLTEANDKYDDRNGYVKIVCGDIQKYITVTQKKKNALLVSASKYEIGMAGGPIEVEVKANVNYEVDIKASEWIHRVETKALETSILKFEIDESQEPTSREGQIIIHSGELSDTISVYQSGSDILVLSQKTYTVSDSGGTIRVELRSNTEYTMKMPDEKWIRESGTRAISTYTKYFEILPNEEYDSRSTTIFFNTKDKKDSVVVTQMQKDALILAQKEYIFDQAGGQLDFDVQTNVELSITISPDSAKWIQQVGTRALATKSLHFNISPYFGSEDRSGSITLQGGGLSQIITVTQHGMKALLDKEREALIALYEATGGANWTNNTHWGSDRPIKEWYGISVMETGQVHEIRLYNNNLSGTLPDVFGDLPGLQTLNLSMNHLCGSIPESLYTLDIISLYLHNNQLEGKLSDKIGQCKNLITFTGSDNNFSGTIPAAFGQLSQLEHCDLGMNRLSGELLPEILALEQKAELQPDFIFRIEPQQPGYTFTSPITRKMIDLGDHFYLHPEGLAIEYRQGKNQAITYEEMKPLMQKVYTKFKDKFDFVVCLYNVGNMEEIAGEIAGQAFSISNAIQGIGRETEDHSAEFGSDGQLKGILCLSDRRQIRGSFLHELMHYWGAFDFGQYTMDQTGAVDRERVHWGISSIDGLLGGFKQSTLERNVDGNPHKYRAVCSQTDWSFAPVNSSSYEYAPLELYLMGLIGSDEVPDIYYYTGISGTSEENPACNGIFYAEEEHILTIEDIIERLGVRTPDYRDSQKSFQILTIVITKEAVTDREWELIEDDMRRMQKQGTSDDKNDVKNFYEATGQRATLTFDGLEGYRK